MILLQGAPERVEVLQFSPDGRTLVAPWAGGVQVWNDITLGGSPATILGHRYVNSIRFTPDGRKLVLGGYLDRLVVHDLPTEEATEFLLEIPDRDVFWELETDGQFLVAAQVTYGNPPGRLFSRPLVDLASSTWSIGTTRTILAPPLFLESGQRFVVVEWFQLTPYGNHCRIYVTREARTGQVVDEVVATGDPFHSLVMSADRRLVAGQRGIWVAVFRADDLGAESVKFRNDNRKEYTSLAFHPSGRFLAATSNDATVKFYDTATWQVAEAFDWDIGRLRSVVFSPDGMLAAAGGDKGKIVVWDIDL